MEMEIIQATIEARKSKKISQEEFNKYYNDKSLTDIVVGEAFLIA